MRKLFLLPQSDLIVNELADNANNATVVRTYLQFVKYIVREGCPDYIYFAEDVEDGGPSVRQAVQFLLNMDRAYRYMTPFDPFIPATFKYTAVSGAHALMILDHTSKFFDGIESTPLDRLEMLKAIAKAEVEKHEPKDTSFVPKDRTTQDQMAALFIQKGTDAQVAEGLAHFRGSLPPIDDGE